LLAASLADEKALSIQYPSISPCCICKRDLPVCRLLGRDAHRRPVLQLRAGLSHQHVSIRPPRSQQAAGPGGHHPGRCTATHGMASWRQPAPRLLFLFASKGKPVRVRTSMLCYLLRRPRPANPAGCFALRPPPASHACCVRGCTRIQFNSNRGGVQNQPVRPRPVWIAISLSLCSPLRLPPLSPRRRAVPPRPARPDGDADPCVLASRTVLCYCPIIQYGLDFPDADELLATTSNKTMSGYCHLRCGACHQGPCPPTTLLRDQSELRTSLSSSSSSSTTSSSMVAFNRDGGWFLRAELSGFRNQERECERFLFLRC
jgi:hypothetical protein